MKRNISRRSFISTVGKAGAAVGAASIIGAPAIVRSQQPLKIVTGTLAGGWTEISNKLLLERNFGAKHGVEFSVFNSYPVLGNYYADVTKGTLEVGIGAWDAFVRMYEKGVPVRLVAVISTGQMCGFFARANGPNKLADLKGKTLAAMQASGTYAMTKTWMKEFDGLDVEKDMQVQNAPNPPATVTLVAGERADAALSWEHSLSAGLHKVPGSKIFMTVGEYYKKHTNREMPFFAIFMRADWIDKQPKGAVERVVASFDDLFKWVHGNEADFIQRAAELKIEPEVMKMALGSGRMRFDTRPLAVEKNREEVLFAANLLTKAGTFEKKLDDRFFA